MEGLIVVWDTPERVFKVEPDELTPQERTFELYSLNGEPKGKVVVERFQHRHKSQLSISETPWGKIEISNEISDPGSFKVVANGREIASFKKKMTGKLIVNFSGLQEITFKSINRICEVNCDFGRFRIMGSDLKNQIKPEFLETLEKRAKSRDPPSVFWGFAIVGPCILRKEDFYSVMLTYSCHDFLEIVRM